MRFNSRRDGHGLAHGSRSSSPSPPAEAARVQTAGATPSTSAAPGSRPAARLTLSAAAPGAGVGHTHRRPQRPWRRLPACFGAWLTPCAGNRGRSARPDKESQGCRELATSKVERQLRSLRVDCFADGASMGPWTIRKIWIGPA